MVEHTTENCGVVSSILTLGTSGWLKALKPRPACRDIPISLPRQFDSSYNDEKVNSAYFLGEMVRASNGVVMVPSTSRITSAAKARQ